MLSWTLSLSSWTRLLICKMFYVIVVSFYSFIYYYFFLDILYLFILLLSSCYYYLYYYDCYYYDCYLTIILLLYILLLLSVLLLLLLLRSHMSHSCFLIDQVCPSPRDCPWVRCKKPNVVFCWTRTGRLPLIMSSSASLTRFSSAVNSPRCTSIFSAIRGTYPRLYNSDLLSSLSKP